MNNGEFNGGTLFEKVTDTTQNVTTTIPYDPTAMMMAVALVGINQKLDSIQEMQQEMMLLLERMERREKSKIRGNLEFLSDVMNQYKNSWNNQLFRNSNHNQVLTIKREADQNIVFYKGELSKKIANKLSAIHGDQAVKKEVQSIQNDLKEFQLALYMFSFSSFLEIMLSENYNTVYLDGASRKIEDYAFQYREVYSDCYTLVEGYSNSSLQAHLLGGMASLSKGAGSVIAKIPGIRNGQLDENLIEASDRLSQSKQKRAQQNMGNFADNRSSGVHVFAENINMVNKWPGGKFCVSVFRQNQEYHIINVHDGAYSPWLQLSWKVGAVCAPRAA